MYISRGTQYISWVYVVGNIVYVLDSKRIYIVCISRGEQSIYRVGNIVYVVGISCGYIMWVYHVGIEFSPTVKSR